MALNSNDLAAWASAIAAVASCVTAFVVARKQLEWQIELDEKRKRETSRREIKTFIEDLSDAFSSVFARAVFDNWAALRCFSAGIAEVLCLSAEKQRPSAEERSISGIAALFGSLLWRRGGVVA